VTVPPAEFELIAGVRPLRAVLVGAGAMGTLWARAIDRHPDVELVGVADTDPRRARAAALRLRRPDLPTGRDLADVDAVADVCVNVTPPDAHVEVCEAALRRGMAVLTEKPAAPTLAAAVRLVAVARSRRRLFMVSQSRSYEPGLGELRRLARRIGPLDLITTDFRAAYQDAGFRTELPDPLLLDMAVHHFDALRYLTGQKAVWVSATTFSPAGSWFSGPAAAAAICELSDGARYSYTGTWCGVGLATSWSGSWRVGGARGAVAWDGVGMPVADPDTGPATVSRPPAPEPSAQLDGPLDDFVRALRTGRPPWGEGVSNLETLAMVQAAIVSSRSGTRVAPDRLRADAERVASRCG
jgi:predicted dehydrogenase